MRQRYDPPPVERVRYVVAFWSEHGYVVYDRQLCRIADGFYLMKTDAQWAADQRNRGWRCDEQTEQQEGA